MFPKISKRRPPFLRRQDRRPHGRRRIVAPDEAVGDRQPAHADRGGPLRRGGGVAPQASIVASPHNASNGPVVSNGVSFVVLIVSSPLVRPHVEQEKGQRDRARRGARLRGFQPQPAVAAAPHRRSLSRSCAARGSASVYCRRGGAGLPTGRVLRRGHPDVRPAGDGRGDDRPRRGFDGADRRSVGVAPARRHSRR